MSIRNEVCRGENCFVILPYYFYGTISATTRITFHSSDNEPSGNEAVLAVGGSPYLLKF